MRKLAFILSLFILSLFFLLSCGEKIKVQRLSVEEAKIFDKLIFTKVWRNDFDWAKLCLPFPRGVFCLELLDKGYKEYKFDLYDFSGSLIKERKILSGEGPDQIRVIGLDSIWASASGHIHCIDNGYYLKSIDPETFKIETILKLSNVIEGYGNKFIDGKHGGTSIEEKENQIVTSFESTGFYENFSYYLVTCDSNFRNLSVLAELKKDMPWTWKKLRETRRINGKRVSFIDYYGRLRLHRMFSVDWKRRLVYIIPAIERPEIAYVDLEGKKKGNYPVDINPEKFKIEREEFDSLYEYFMSNEDPILKNYYNFYLYLPPHAPALMGIQVIKDWLLIITGNRNWQKGENEVLVYKLPELKYEGSFFIPFPSFYQAIKFYENYYITVNTREEGDDYKTSFEIFRIEEK